MDAKGKISFEINLDNETLRRQADEAKRILDSINQTAHDDGKKIDETMKKVGAGVAAYFSVSALKGFASQVASVRGQFQQLEAAFETMLGTKEKADALMSQLIKTAATTPFGMTEVASGAKQLLAYGVEADKVNETLVRLGDIAAGLSLPIGDLAYLYGSTMVQGRMYTQDLNQFLGRGIPLTKELAKQFGVAESQVKQLVSEGKVGFPEVEKAIVSLTSEGGQFAGLMENQSHTITGQISNIEDSIEQMFNEIGRMTEGPIEATLDVTGKIVENWENIGKAVASVIVGYGLYKGAVLASYAAQQIAAKGSIIAWISQTTAVHGATGAVRAFNAAVMANPIGAILGVVAAAASAFYMFGDSTDDATEAVTRFGESGANQLNKVNTLTTTLKGLTAGTSTHKKALDELNNVLSEYGLKQLTEKAGIEEINRARLQAIELIKEEAIERQRANRIEEASQSYNSGMDEWRKTLNDRFKNAIDNKLGTSGEKEMEQWSQQITDVIDEVVSAGVERTRGKSKEEVNKIYAEMTEQVKSRLTRMGLDADNIVGAKYRGLWSQENILKSAFEEAKELNDARDEANDRIQKQAEASKKAAEATMTLAERQDALRNKLQKAGDGVHELYRNINNLVQKYDGKKFDFSINVADNVPDWMKKMDSKTLQNFAKTFTVLGETNPNGAIVNGKKMSQQELLQRGFLYAKAAEEKQLAIDKENELKNSEEYKKEQERLKKEAETLENERFKRTQAIEKYKKEVTAQEAQARIEIRQQEIEMMEEGTGKQIASIDLNYERMKAEIKKKEEDMLSALADSKVNEWMNTSKPKATEKEQAEKKKSLLEELTTDDLTEVQKAQIERFKELAKEIKDLEIGKVVGAEDAINEYLKQYGDYQAKKYAIAEEYAARIKAIEKSSDTDEQKSWKIRSIKEEQSQTNSQIEANLIMQRIDWTTVVGNLGGIMSNALEPLLEDLKAYAKTNSFKNLGADQQRQIIEAMGNIRNQIGNTGDLNWKDLANDMQAYHTSMKTAKRLQEEYNALELELIPKINEAKESLKKAVKDKDEQAQKRANEELSNYANKLADASNVLSIAKTNVSTSGHILSQTADAVCQPISKVSEFLNNANLGQIGEIFNGIDELRGGIAALKGLKAADELKKAGKELADETAKVGEGLADAAKQAGDAALKGIEKAGLIGKIIAAIIKILDAIKEQGLGQIVGTLLEGISDGIEGFFKNSLNGNDVKGLWNGIKDLVWGILEGIIGGLMNLFTGGKRDSLFGSNAKEVEEYTNRLTKESEALRYSIDKLKDSIDNNLGVKAIEAYKTAYEDQKKTTENTRLILNKQMEYTDSHHSNSYYWNVGQSNADKVNELLGTSLRKDYWSDWAKLTAEQMEQIKIHLPDVWSVMLDQGEYDKSKYFNNYVEEAHKLDELTEKIQTNLMGMSFESMRDSFVDSLMDMSKDTDDYAREMAEKFQRALLKASVGKKYEEEMKKWYNAVTKEMEDKGGELDKDRIEYYQEQYRKIVDAGIAESERIAEMTGYDGGEAGREASKKGIATASQDSVDELNGRATAIQGHTFSINENTKLLTSITSDILRSVINIDHNTEDIPARMVGMEATIRGLKSSVDDIAMKGIKIR